MNLEDNENIVYAQLELPSGGQVPPGPRKNTQNAAEDGIVYANITDPLTKPGMSLSSYMTRQLNLRLFSLMIT